jgi:glycosyltransferase involved in cell wall biosynthesis
MNIIYHHRIASRDGQYVHVIAIVNSLRARGHNVFLIGPAGIHKTEFGERNSFIYYMKCLIPRFIYELLELSYCIFSFSRLYFLCRNQNIDAIYERYNLYSPAGALVARHLKIPFLLEVNAPLAQERARYSGLALPKLAQKIEMFTWRAADSVLAVTKVLADIVIATGVAPERVQVVPNGVNPVRFASLPAREAAKAALGLEGKRVVGFVGFVREWMDRHGSSSSGRR